MSKDIQATVTHTAEEIQEWLLRNIADRLDIDPRQIDPEEPITNLGLSSRETIMLSGELEDWLDRRLSPELLYEYPKIKELAEILSKGTGDVAQTNQNRDARYDEMEFSSVVDLLIKRANDLQTKVAYTHLLQGELANQDSFTYKQLGVRAKAIGAYLQQNKLEGERILILLPSGISFVCSFYGSLFGKAVAVPAFPPQKTRGAERIEAIFRDAGAKYAFVDTDLLEKINNNRKLKDSFLSNSIHWINVDEIPDTLADQWKKPQLSHRDLAFLQYTSGSTGEPKGVMISHGNILHNCKVMRLSFDLHPGMMTVSWLPMYHDMGLIGCILCLLNMQGHLAFMSPTDFLEKPIRWLKAISHFKCDFSTAPNFAYDLLVEKVKPEELSELDLSSWIGAGNGSEPINPETLRRFSNHFSSCGFKHNHHYPCYGMAESTLMITGINPQTETTVLELDDQLLEENIAKIAVENAGNRTSKISCGYNHLGVLKIVNPDTCEALPENRIGEIWYQSESVAQGYWNKPELTEETFKAKIANGSEGFFLRTGDMGFLHNGELYITGRMKDLIIIRGRNHYPQDIEKTVQQSHPALTINGGAAFSVNINNTERLVVVQEVERTALKTLIPDEVFSNIKAAVAGEHEIHLYAIVLLSPGRLPRTTSGKIQRGLAKKGFLDDTLAKIEEWKLSQEALNSIETAELFLPPLKELKQMTEANRFATIRNYLVELIGMTLNIPGNRIETSKPVVNLGLDSMHAIQLKSRLESDFRLNMELSELLGEFSIDNLAEKLSADVSNEEKKINEPLTGPNGFGSNGHSKEFSNLTADQARELLTDIDNLTQEEIEKLLEILSGEQQSWG